MELQLPVWVYVVTLVAWAIAGFWWGRVYEQRRGRKSVPRRESTITVSDASALYEGQVIVAVNPNTLEQSEPMTVAKIGKGKRP